MMYTHKICAKSGSFDKIKLKKVYVKNGQLVFVWIL